jgi:hypothetical protein
VRVSEFVLPTASAFEYPSAIPKAQGTLGKCVARWRWLNPSDQRRIPAAHSFVRAHLTGCANSSVVELLVDLLNTRCSNKKQLHIELREKQWQSYKVG